MTVDANPSETNEPIPGDSKQTIEFRAPDGSADVYKLLAGLVIGAMHGLKMPNAVKKARDLYVDVNIFEKKSTKKLRSLAKLPASCYDSAECLQKQRAFFEEDGIFPPEVLDYVISHLKSYKDKDLSERLEGKNKEIRELVMTYIHVM